MHESTPRQSDSPTNPDSDPLSSLQSNSSRKLGFRDLGESIIESLSIGVIAFNLELKIIEANSQAAKLVDLGEYIDKSLAKGTDANIWGNWTELLNLAISTNKKSEFEAVRYSLNNQKRLLHIVCTPLRQSHTQEALGGAVVIADVTEKVNIEHQLTQAERLAAIGKVAGKVAHELNNPMDGILRYINLAIRSIDEKNYDKPKEYLQHCRSGLMRMVQIIGELLEFSRSTHSAFEYAQIDEIVKDAVKACESRTNQVNVQIILDCPKGVPQVKSGSLFQVFCNLIKNAIDAMQGQGKLKITIRCDVNVLLVEFHDTGPGFAPEHAETIFEPFFTTKSHGKGTGLGLAICKDIIEKYDGRITAENSPNSGSIFTVHLPLTTENSLQAG